LELATINPDPVPKALPPAAKHCEALGHVTSFKMPTPVGTALLVHVVEAVGPVDMVEVVAGGAGREVALVVDDTDSFG
jgi:hypothetical protein